SACALPHLFVFFPTPSPTPLSTLSLHDALPISGRQQRKLLLRRRYGRSAAVHRRGQTGCSVRPDDKRRSCYSSLGYSYSTVQIRSEEHTSELQSRFDLVCRLLLEKKKHTYLTFI